MTHHSTTPPAPNAQSQDRPKAIVLLSGGLDSATILAIANNEGYRTYALSFDYGQRHREELEACTAVARALGVTEHKVLKLDLRAFGGSALTADLPVPRCESSSEVGKGAIPITYVPARNTIFLSYALAWAEVIGAGHIFIGVNAVDFSGYPDCTPQFIEAFQAMANTGTQRGVEGDGYTIEAPLLNMSKGEIVKLGTSLGVDYGITITCYCPVNGLACGTCESCILRRRGFVEAGIKDPTLYVPGVNLEDTHNP